MQVKVATLPGAVREVTVDDEAPTLAAALRAFGLDPGQARDVRVNNNPVSRIEDFILEANAFITVVGQVRGG